MKQYNICIAASRLCLILVLLLLSSHLAIAEDGDNGVSLVPISYRYEWVANDAVTSEGYTQDTYQEDGRLYIAGNNFSEPAKDNAEKNYYGITIKNNRGIGFKLAAGMSYVIRANYIGAYTYNGDTNTTQRGFGLKSGETFSNSTFVVSMETNGHLQTLEYEVESSDADQVFWLTGHPSWSVDVYLISFSVVPRKTLSYLTVINSDFTWRMGNTEKANSNDLPSNNYIGDYSTYRLGSTATSVVTATTVNYNGVSFYTCNLAESAIAFKIANGKKGRLNFYIKDDGNLHLRKGSDYGDAQEVTCHNTLIGNGAATNIISYDFDLQEGDEIFWIDGDGYFGGFDALFDESTPALATSQKTITDSGLDWYIVANQSSMYCNYVDKTYYKLVSGANGDNTYLAGPSCAIVDFANKHLTDSKTIMLSDQNALGFKLPANKMATVKIYYFGDNGTGVKLLKGSIPSSATEVAGSTGISSGDYFGADQYIEVPQFQTGSSDEVYWITGVNDDFVYFAGYEVVINDLPAELLTINEYYLWDVTEPTLSQNSLTDGNHIFFESNTDETLTGGTLNVLGSAVGTYSIGNWSEYIGFKIAQGKVGKIKVYYTGKSTTDTYGTDMAGSIYGDGGWGAGGYDSSTSTITYTEDSGGARGWYWGNRDFSAYTHFEVELENATNASATFSLWLQYTTGFDASGNRTYATTGGSFTYDSSTGKWKISFPLDPLWAQALTQICITSSGAGSVKVASAKMVNHDSSLTPTLTLLQGGTDTSHSDATQVASATGLSGTGCTVDDIAGTNVMTYDFNTTSAGKDQIYWVTGDLKIAAIEVLFTEDHSSDIIWWYVNPDCKMIVGSELETVAGYDEVATYYVSKGRKAKFSFFMPYTLQCLYDKSDDCSYDYTNEVDVNNVTWTAHGSNPCYVDITNGGISSTRYYPRRYDDSNKLIGAHSSTHYKNKIFRWMGEEDVSPPVDGDHLRAGNQERILTITAHQGSRTHKVYLKFIYLDAPQISVSGTGAVTIENDDLKDDLITQYFDTATEVTVTITPGDNTDDSVSSAPIYYTMNSNDPDDLLDSSLTQDQRYATRQYDDSAKPVMKTDGIISAAQYITTDRPFYTDGIGSETSRRFMLVSEDMLVQLADGGNIIYVKRPTGGFKSTSSTDGLFSNGRSNSNGGFDANSIDVLTSSDSKDLMSIMYGTKEVKYLLSNSNATSSFRIGGVKWSAGGSAQDWDYDTFIDAYKFHMDGGNDPYYSNLGLDYNDNGNPYTECNQGIGNANTEDGGMFLQPVSADFFRLEPEYDGVVTLWIRQNGVSEDNTLSTGNINRRPVYVLDEDGRIMRATTIKPTAEHHLAIDGVYAINSGRSQFRYDFDLSWKFGVYGSQGWNASTTTRDTYKVYAYRFHGLPQLGSDLTSSSGTVFFDRKYDTHRFLRPGQFPLYRDDWFVNDIERGYLGVSFNRAKYGFEVPNYTYMRYRIPVKAGRSYYIGGRGTKNGFVAVQFEVLDCNYDNLDYRLADNPDITGNDTHGPAYGWNFNVPSTPKSFNETTALATYSDASVLKTYVLDGNQAYGSDWLGTTTDVTTAGKYWFEDGEVNVLNWNGANPVVGTTINVQLRRNMKAGNWYPIVLPFSVSESRMTQYFGEGVKVLYLDPKAGAWYNEEGDYQSGQKYHSVYRPAINGTKLNFTYHKYQMLYANTPAFICPTFEWTDGKSNHPDVTVTDGVNTVSTITFDRVNYAGADIRSYEIGNGYEVTGSYLPTQASDHGAMYFISNDFDQHDNPVVVVYHAPDGAPMKGTRVWIQKKDAGSAPLRTVSFSTFDGEDFNTTDTSAISDIVMEATAIDMYDNDNVYDLMGRIVGHGTLDGLQKGVYIFQGKKHYVR